jgi:hypothetical protein
MTHFFAFPLRSSASSAVKFVTAFPRYVQRLASITLTVTKSQKIAAEMWNIK